MAIFAFAGIALLVTAACLFFLWRHAKRTLFAFSMSLAISGALGNLWDRLVYGYVTDFSTFTRLATTGRLLTWPTSAFAWGRHSWCSTNSAEKGKLSVLSTASNRKTVSEARRGFVCHNSLSDQLVGGRLNRCIKVGQHSLKQNAIAIIHPIAECRANALQYELSGAIKRNRKAVALQEAARNHAREAVARAG